MGFTAYNLSARVTRSASCGFETKSMAEVFTQQKERRAHESMIPKGINKRECFDSESHPNTVPIVLGLDVTGSMRTIPHQLIKNGLPTLMSTVIQQGVPDASLLFICVGDHEYDGYALQVGQFESGDAELDHWLTRSYLEGGGGGNAGESYLLAWYFAAFHTDIDSFNKRKKKGFLITVGDEPGLTTLPASAIKEIMGSDQAKSYTDVQLLEAAQKMYDVYHIVVLHSSGASRSLPYWQNILGQHCLTVDSADEVAPKIAELVYSNSEASFESPKAAPSQKAKAEVTEEIL